MKCTVYQAITRHVLSANSSLKLRIKSTRVNFSRNPIESFKIYFICKIVSNLRIEFFTILILSRTKRKMDARVKNMIYGISFMHALGRHTINECLLQSAVF